MSTEQNDTKADTPSHERLGSAEVAAKIVRDLFELGDEPNSPTQRIQFMGGKWTGNPESEIGQGGFSEGPFSAWLSKKLTEYGWPNTGRQVRREEKQENS